MPYLRKSRTSNKLRSFCAEPCIFTEGPFIRRKQQVSELGQRKPRFAFCGQMNNESISWILVNVSNLWGKVFILYLENFLSNLYHYYFARLVNMWRSWKRLAYLYISNGHISNIQPPLPPKNIFQSCELKEKTICLPFPCPCEQQKIPTVHCQSKFPLFFV